MITWGITALTHDASISVIRDNEILFAAHAERYSKSKNDPNLNEAIIQAAREYGSPDLVVWFENRWLKKWRQFKHLQWRELLNLSRWPHRYLKTFGIHQDVTCVKHHLSHAASGFLTSPYQNATILCIDSLGEENTVTMWRGSGANIEPLFEINYPTSLGLLYSAFTKRIGLKPNEEEYILMGMAAYGEPIHADQIENDFFKDGLFSMKRNCIKGIGHYLPSAYPENLAASIQLVTERVLEKLLIKAKALNSSENLIYSGGVALNCVANRLLLRHFKNVWIMPNPGDAGSSLGAAAYATRTRLRWRGPYLGTNIEGEYPVDQIVDELLKSKIVGVANGRAEFGPRALGNRSLFADPRGIAIKDRVNKIKQRQAFRPFAPVIMEEHARSYFEMPLQSSPYMQYTMDCLEPLQYPAICHFDNTSRVQTVTLDQHPGLYNLLEVFYAKTGCPMLLNTSLNVKGMPLVDTKDDALKFKQTYGVEVL